MTENRNLNESLIRDVVTEVLGRLGRRNGTTASTSPSAASAPAAPTVMTRRPGSRRFGVFGDVAEAAEAAQRAYEQLSEKGVAGRVKVIEIVKELCCQNAREWGRVELEETKIGRLDHKIEKLEGQRGIPGVEFLHPYGLSGDHGITLEEYAPFGVVGAVTPSTHSIPTMACNIITMAAGGNAAVFNAHPGAYRCAVMAARVFNEAIYHELGIENLACIIDPPTLESFTAMGQHPLVKILCVTGGPGVVAAAMKSGKRAVCAGPGNPPVLVDGTGCLDRAARDVITGGAYDNNLLCIGEKEVFVLDPVFDKFMNALEKHGAHRLTSEQVERLTGAVFVFPEGKGAGCGEAAVNRDFVGRDPEVLAKLAGALIPDGTQLLFAETPADHPFVIEEQMMPFVPIVRVKSVSEGVRLAKQAERGYKHSAMIHSHDVAHMTEMAKALETTIFIKNGPCIAGLGNGGEGYPNYSIATTTGEGITNPRTFTRVRRCVMVDKLRIF